MKKCLILMPTDYLVIDLPLHRRISEKNRRQEEYWSGVVSVWNFRLGVD
jgi:hypothetical protein